MKKFILFCLVVFFSIAGISQPRGLNNRFEVLDPNTAGKIFHNPLNQKSKPKGSPYLQLMFAAAKVDNVEQKTFMRYNVFNDEFEFITPKNDTLILDKIDDFGTIAFAGTNKKYILANYTNNGKLSHGYLINVYEKAGLGLFKKENITFYEEKIARTTLEKDMPAKYVKANDSYFFRNKTGAISEFPDSKKQLIKLYPDKKTAIETFVKDNKIQFDIESDQIKIIDFLSAL